MNEFLKGIWHYNYSTIYPTHRQYLSEAIPERHPNASILLSHLSIYPSLPLSHSITPPFLFLTDFIPNSSIAEQQPLVPCWQSWSWEQRARRTKLGRQRWPPCCVASLRRPPFEWGSGVERRRRWRWSRCGFVWMPLRLFCLFVLVVCVKRSEDEWSDVCVCLCVSVCLKRGLIWLKLWSEDALMWWCSECCSSSGEPFPFILLQQSHVVKDPSWLFKMCVISNHVRPYALSASCHIDTRLESLSLQPHAPWLNPRLHPSAQCGIRKRCSARIGVPNTVNRQRVREPFSFGFVRPQVKGRDRDYKFSLRVVRRNTDLMADRTMSKKNMERKISAALMSWCIGPGVARNSFPWFEKNRQVLRSLVGGRILEMFRKRGSGVSFVKIFSGSGDKF